VVVTDSGSVGEIPQGARTVERGTMRCFAVLARSAAWVTSGLTPREAVKSPWTVCVQIPDGTPVRWEGFDDPRMKRATNDDRLALRRAIDRWDALCVRAPYDEEIRARAYRHQAEALRVGLPRNDLLVHADAARATEARTRLGVPPGVEAVALLFACGSLAIEPQRVAPGRGQVVLGAEQDLDLVLLAADVLVTDHHPAMFDVVLRDTPVVVVGCRCAVRDGAGSRAETYLPIDDAAPGPVVWDVASLSRELADLPGLRARTVRERHAARQRFAAWDTGRAAAGVVDFLLERCESLRRPCDEVDQ
jgi:CRISPR system Cascade subunit CasB